MKPLFFNYRMKRLCVKQQGLQSESEVLARYASQSNNSYYPDRYIQSVNDLAAVTEKIRLLNWDNGLQINRDGTLL